MKLKLTILTLLVALTATFAQAQKVVTIEGVYRYQQPADESLNVARSKAIDRARIQALSQKFGTTVSSSSNSRVHNGKTSFFQIGMNEVKGEWLGDVSDPVITTEIDPATQLPVITARVKFKAREIVNEAVPVEAHILRNGTSLKNEDNEFFSGDQMYIHFKAPIDGYLVIYELGETDNVARLIPYDRSRRQAYIIKANKDYIFFSLNHLNDGELKSTVDEITMTASKATEWNRYCFIFSPNEFVRAIDQDGGSGSGTKLGLGHQGSVKLPRTLKNEDFQKWLTQSRSRDRKMSYTTIDITTTRKQ
ncbi:MAG: hypothetical protein ACI4UN_01770 [Muribaculaceae bacterium]